MWDYTSLGLSLKFVASKAEIEREMLKLWLVVGPEYITHGIKPETARLEEKCGH